MERRRLRIVLADVIDRTLFVSLLLLIALVAVPYGTVEPWWKGVFQSLVFIFAGLSIIEYWLRGDREKQDRSVWRGGRGLLLPVLALIVFALIQTLQWPGEKTGSVSDVNPTISADPFQTRIFVMHICALAFFGWMLVRHVRNRRRLYFLIETIIAVAVITAGFGLLRQATQNQVGFGLPYLRPGFGYGQFINTNHFAFLMEMALGLSLGIAVSRRLQDRRLVVYLIAAVPMWLAVVLSNSRGGIVSILFQVLLLAGILVSGSDRKQLEAETRLARIRQRVGQAILVCVFLIGSVFIVIFVGGDPLAQRAASLSTEFNQKTAETYTLRTNIWQATWSLIKEHPLTGVGFGGYWIAITKYHRASGEMTPQEAHNDYLELLASGGIVGFGIGVWLVVVFARLARSALRTANSFGRAVTLGAVTGIVTVSVHSLTDFGLHITINAVVFTALIAMVSIIHKQSSSILNSPEPSYRSNRSYST